MKIQCEYTGKEHELETLEESECGHWAIGYCDGNPAQWEWPSEGKPDYNHITEFDKSDSEEFTDRNDRTYRLENGKWKEIEE